MSILVAALQRFSTLGIDFISYTQNIDTTRAMGCLFYHVIGSFAEFERETIVKLVRAGLANARAKGKALGRPKDRGAELRIIDLRKQAEASRDQPAQGAISLRCALNPPRCRYVWRTRVRNARNQRRRLSPVQTQPPAKKLDVYTPNTRFNQHPYLYPASA